MEVLKLEKVTGKGNFYVSEADQSKYLLRVVDRQYQGVTKKPVYYMSKVRGSKSEFISGLFPTKDPDTFSYDEKNNIGMKVFKVAIFKDQGQVLELNTAH